MTGKIVFLFIFWRSKRLLWKINNGCQIFWQGWIIIIDQIMIGHGRYKKDANFPISKFNFDIGSGTVILW